MSYTCATCGKTADHLSESWSTITVQPQLSEPGEPEVYHFCLECRSIKQVWTGTGMKVPDGPAQ